MAAFAVLACALVAVAAGCGGGGEKSTSTTTSTSTTSGGANPTIAAMVPAKYKSKGSLTVASDATYAPDEFIASNGKTVVGMDPDLGAALGKVMGLKVNFVNATFDTIIPGLSSGKYDLGMSSFTDTKAREKVVDFVTYFTAGMSIYTKASGGTTLTNAMSMCGHSVAAETGTTEADFATAQSGTCTKAGKPAVTVHTYPDQNATNLAVASGRADVGMADSPVAAYIVKQSAGKFKLTGPTLQSAPYGIAVPKNSGLTKPILAALKELMSNGTYTTILQKWGIQQGAITNPTINGAIS